MSRACEQFTRIVCSDNFSYDAQYQICIACLHSLKRIGRNATSSAKLVSLLELVITRMSNTGNVRLKPILLSLFITVVKKCIGWYVNRSIDSVSSMKVKSKIDLLADKFQESMGCCFIFNHSQICALKDRMINKIIIEIGAEGNLINDLMTHEGFIIYSDRLDQKNHSIEQGKCKLKKKYSPSEYLDQFSSQISQGDTCLMIPLPISYCTYDIEGLLAYERLGGEYVMFCGSADWCGSREFIERLETKYSRVYTFEGYVPMPLVSDDSPIDSIFINTDVYVMKKNQNENLQ